MRDDEEFNSREIGYDEEREKTMKESLRHPSPEMLLMKQAVKYLTPKQRKMWDFHNFDRMTQDEIAEKLGITQQSVSKQIHGIESKLTKWVKSNFGAYELLKRDYSKASNDRGKRNDRPRNQ